MDCTHAREAISALLDDEPAGVEPAELSLHVAECADCRVWREGAHEVTRRVRLAPADPAPNASPELLATVRNEMRRGSQTRRPVAVTRLALVVIAVAQIAMTVPALILGSDREAPLHVAHEMGSFGMALAVGFLIVAWQPIRARGMHMLVGVAALLLIVTAVIDLLAGRTSLSDEAPHLLVLAGWALMYRIAVETPPNAEDGRGQSLLRQRRRALFGLDEPVWQGAPGRDVGADAPAVERRAASA
jgi:predicted anti-sigma-YlaC factor YlaD